MENLSGVYILLAEDDPDLRVSLSELIQNAGYNVESVQNGAEAQKKLTEKSYDLILSDYKMPEVSGLDLLRFVKKNYKTPFVLTTGFIDLIEANEAIRIGADGFLPKPFKVGELEDLFSSLLSLEPQSLVNTQEEKIQFCRIPIYEFTSSSTLKLDVFVKLSENKYLRIAKESHELAGQRIEKYKAKGVEYLYIKQDEFNKYVGLNVTLAKAAMRSPKISDSKKVSAVIHAAEVLLQHTYVNGLDPEKFANSKEILLMSLGVMTQDMDLLSLLSSLNHGGDWMYSHALGVALYAGLIANELKWKSELTKGKVLMAGLFHDIGLKEIDGAILQKNRIELDKNEVHIYESHCTRGRDILSRIASVPEEVALVALEHHENCNGTGYPSKLKKDQISPLSKLINVADTFCELALKGPPNSTPLSPEDAITRMLNLNKGDFDHAYLSPLLNILTHPAATTLAD